MLRNKKYAYLGISLFSTMALISLTPLMVKADTTTADVAPIVTKPTNNSTIVKADTKVALPQSGASSVVSKPATQTSTAVVPSANKTTVTSSTATPYEIPTNINNNTVVSFDDSLLESMVKSQLNLNSTQNITVEDIKKFNDPEFDVDETTYLSNLPNADPNLTSATVPPIESLNGMQYLQLLSKGTQVYLGIKLASDSKANEDLTPLEKIKFAKITMYGNYSDSKAKEIEVDQLANIGVNNLQYLNLSGDPTVSNHDGLTNQQLEKIAPWIVQYSNNGQTYSKLEMDNSQLTDLSSLANVNKKNGLGIFVADSNSSDSTPIEATTGKTINFNAEPIIGIDGEKIASDYHYTTTVPADKVADDDLANLGNGKYEIIHPDTNAKNLNYGNIGWYINSNNDDMISRTYGTVNLQYYGLHTQPIVWTTSGINNSKPKVVHGSVIAPSSPASISTPATASIPAISQTVVKPKINSSPITETEIKQGVLRTNSLTKLVNADGEMTSTTLEPNTAWTYNKIVTIKGTKYYQVATDEYVPVSHVLQFDPLKALIKVSSGSVGKLYNSNGQQSKANIPANSTWMTDGSTTINGVTMYRVATDEWIPVTEIQNPYQKITLVYKATKSIPVYNADGKVTSVQLKPGTSWKVDRKVWIGGVAYYRIATNDFVKA